MAEVDYPLRLQCFVSFLGFAWPYKQYVFFADETGLIRDGGINHLIYTFGAMKIYMLSLKENTSIGF